MASELNVGKVVAENSASQQIEIGDGAGSSWDFGRNTTSGSLVIRQNTTEKLAVSSTGLAVTGAVTTTGNVGIGTSSPLHPLHVEKSKAGDNLVRFENTHATGDGLYIKIASDAYNAFRIYDAADAVSFGVKGSGAVTAAGLATFSAGIALGNTGTASTGTPSSPAQTLDWYEEGSWTPTAFGLTEALVGPLGLYTRIGNMVHWSAYILIPTTTDTDAVRFPLPFTVKNSGAARGNVTIGYQTSGLSYTALANHTNSDIYMYTAAGVAVGYDDISGQALYMGGSFPVA